MEQICKKKRPDRGVSGVPNLLNTLRVDKPWGSFEQFTLNMRSTVKFLNINMGHRLSYQSHSKRSEFWMVVKGKIKATLDGEEKQLCEGESVDVPVGMRHRIEALEDSKVLEIALGEFDENDIIRYEDDYKRA